MKKNQGRPLKYGEKMRQLNIRVPASKYDYIKSIVTRWINKKFNK